MDIVEFFCPNCGKMLTVAAKYAGEIVRCPSCSSEVAVPLEGGI